ncbi:pre-rRNA 2'-O-ribose RNA methyltransferase FTSJ3, partial [Uranotaenia lowii]|uniref:pre-rRNA 2'-O-ribose RNA methyltransferase FTSJ3 n=1 Tax=Uranotaenia lowii TaxID=190385 RepID=UPI0024788525
PRFLDAKYVFEELDVEPQVKVNLLKEVEKTKKAKVVGYEGTDVRKIISAVEFLKSDKPLQLLAQLTEINFAGEDNKTVRNHPRTTGEIRECCKDIKVLGRKDLKDLLRWHKLISGELFPQEENQDEAASGKGGKLKEKMEEEAEETGDEETVELKNMEKEIATLRKEEEQDAKRKRKKANKERTKLNEKMNLKMVIKGDEGPTETADAMMFSLNAVKNKKEIDHLLDSAPDILAEPSYHDDDDDGLPKKKQKFVKYDKNTKGDLFEDDTILGKQSDDDSDADLDKTGLGLDDTEELEFEREDDDEEAGDSDDPDSKNPLITDLDYRDKDEKRRHKAQLWFEKETFKNVLGQEDQALDYDLDRLTDMYKKSGVKIIGEDNENRPLGKKARQRARHTKEENSSSEDSDSEVDAEDETFEHKTVVEKVGGKDGFEVVSSEKKAKKVKLSEEELALGQMLVSGKKSRRDLVDAAWNRYMFNDSHLPDWFIKDEEKTMKKSAPVPHEVVETYKKNLEEINVRSIKKVMEAKARKKKHAAKRLEKIKKKAETIMDNVDNTNQEKIRLLKKLYKKQDAKKKDITYVVAKKSGTSGKKVRRPKGVEGRFKVVDPRMKKDKRGEDAKMRRSVKRSGKSAAKAKASRPKAGGKGKRK